MQFGPQNPIVRLCIQGMQLEAQGQVDDARACFLRAWDEAGDAHERLLAAHHVSRLQEAPTDQLSWLEKALELAGQVDDPSVAPAVPFLSAQIADAYEQLGDRDRAAAHRARATAATEVRDPGPFFHGTRTAMRVGDLLRAGHGSNYESGLIMNHVFFTAVVDGAGLAAALARGEGPERVYVVEPTGAFENDPNVTNKRFVGNPTRSYRSEAPLAIVAELSEWTRPAAELVRAWRERVAQGDGQVIN